MYKQGMFGKSAERPTEVQKKIELGEKRKEKREEKMEGKKASLYVS